MADAAYPPDLRYHPAHDWARIAGETATFGITWYAQEAVGEIVFFEPPPVGLRVVQGGGYAELESVKAVSEVIAPLSGEVIEVNEEIADEPEAINADPYGAGWMAKVRLADPAEAAGLLDAAEYERLLGDG